MVRKTQAQKEQEAAQQKVDDGIKAKIVDDPAALKRFEQRKEAKANSAQLAEAMAPLSSKAKRVVGSFFRLNKDVRDEVLDFIENTDTDK